MDALMKPKLYIVIPCYNEEQVLPITAPMFLTNLNSMIVSGKIAPDSRILFVDDGSKDNTWSIIKALSEQNSRFSGIRQSRNRGHQNAVLAGLMEAMEQCDITISIDCDGQDDISAMERMVDEYLTGSEIVYGVRSSRETDTFFKRTTARGFYKLLSSMGVETIYDHADYRLVSSRVLREFADFKEVNLFLRGMFPLVGFKSTCVEYERSQRLAGESKYPLRKMLALAFEGITSLSIQPLRLIMGLGGVIAALSFIGVIWSIAVALMGSSVPGWASMTCIICFIGGVQLTCIGILGEYIGKIYLEVKQRPRYIISERTPDVQ
jgi:glycosyltransferase involved in cell wall biosynthesis